MFASLQELISHCVFLKYDIHIVVPPAVPLQKPTNKNQATIWRTREEKEKYVPLYIVCVQEMSICTTVITI